VEIPSPRGDTKNQGENLMQNLLDQKGVIFCNKRRPKMRQGKGFKKMKNSHLPVGNRERIMGSPMQGGGGAKSGSHMN